MKRFTVAATQLASLQGDVSGAIKTHLQMIGQAADQGCQLVVFPELSISGHNGSIDVIRQAEPLDGPIAATIRECAAKHEIVVGYGFCELYHGTHYNSYVLSGPHGLVGVQRKVHASFDEFLRFRQAYEMDVFDLGFCRAGTAICHDSDFFETWRILALKGAEVVLLPHANRKVAGRDGTLVFDGEGINAPEDELLDVQAELIEERPDPPRFHDVAARDNAVYAVFSDLVGFDGRSTHVGGAYVLAPDGSMVARSSPGAGTEMITASLDPELLDRVRENPAFALRKRRPEVYRELTIER